MTLKLLIVLLCFADVGVCGIAQPLADCKIDFARPRKRAKVLRRQSNFSPTPSAWRNCANSCWIWPLTTRLFQPIFRFCLRRRSRTLSRENPPSSPCASSQSEPRFCIQQGIACLDVERSELVGLRLKVAEPASDYDCCTSSVVTWKLTSRALPNDVVIAQSVASRPVAINTRPMRRTLCLASNVHQRSPR